jgi:hypothetical protein
MTIEDTIPSYNCIILQLTGQPLCSQLYTNPVQAPPKEVIDLIDLDMEDSEALTKSSHQDNWAFPRGRGLVVHNPQDLQ